MQNNVNIQICRKCNKEKSLDDFYRDYRSLSHRSVCKACHLEAERKWRSTHREQHNAGAMKWAKANPEKIKEINQRNYVKQNEKRDAIKEAVLTDHPCIVCGETDQILLDFHHLDPSVKEYAVASHSLTWRAMLREIAKCVVLCCRCHRKHHWRGMSLPEPLVPVDTSDYF
jgi:hypothetical protein